jgi:feruloyl esterase
MARLSNTLLGGLLAAGSALALSASAPSSAQPASAPASAGGGACAGLEQPGLFADTRVVSARMVAADAAKGLPAFCEVTGMVSPAAGSNIGVVYRLPEGWNGKLLGLGGGGWAGNVRIDSAVQGLSRGYATAQTDGGHASTGPWETAWASNPEARTDFAYRAIHLMTVVGKQVAAKYYGRVQSKTYYQGCSTGGRQGLMEVQRFPGDYDAVIAGAPVYTLQVQTSAVLRDLTLGAPSAGFTAEQMQLVNKAVLAACDAKDGLADGIITDPRACKWDPGALLCKAGQSAGASCLSAGEVDALRTVYNGIHQGGSVQAWPLSRGSEPGWSLFIQTSANKPDASNGGGLGGLKPYLLGDPDFDLAKFDATRDTAKVRSSDFGRMYEAGDPKIDAFTKRGGKLLLWHGGYDPGPSAVGTIAYYDAVKAQAPASAANVRLFIAPGVNHCGGGPGPDRIDLLAALDEWSLSGKPPATLLATKANAKISRPLCPYPAMPHYKGSGDPDAAASFECR